METKHAHNRFYEDFDPVFKWRREHVRDTLELHLPGMLYVLKLHVCCTYIKHDFNIFIKICY